MKNPLVTILSLSIIVSPIVAQNKSATKTPNQTQTTAPAPPRKLPFAFGLAEDTPVKLRLTQNLSSATAKVDDKVIFEVIEDVKVGEVVVIQHGATALATVTDAHPKRRMGRSGKLDVNIDSVRLVDGEKVTLRAVKGGSGGNHVGAMTGAMVATGIVFFPAAPLFLFMHGKNIEIPKGTEINAFVAADTPLDQSKFMVNAPPAATVAAAPAPPAVAEATEASSVVVKSTPDGADITVDGKYMGSTESTLRLAPGDHTISIQKAGYKPWQRRMTVNSSGNVTVDATLEKTP